MSIQHEHADDVHSYEDIEGSVYLRAGHVQVVYEVDHTNCPGHEGDVLQLQVRPQAHL